MRVEVPAGWSLPESESGRVVEMRGRCGSSLPAWLDGICLLVGFRPSWFSRSIVFPRLFSLLVPFFVHSTVFESELGGQLP